MIRDCCCFIRHYRIDRETGELKRYRRGRSDWRPAERGGMTTCRIVDGGGRVVGMGAAYCSMADNFCYRLGRAIATGRAKKDVRLEAEDLPRKVTVGTLLGVVECDK